ncbi:MAG: DoxX family membrane protein [Bacteroidales bacterium]|nr:DoxX family membrane protein [Bacteroidales bacterium]MBN2763678.1 DoxX family membrane protein [Bacteroidales bacterium]
MAKAYSGRDYALAQLIFLVLLRVSIGWHLLYEGVVKIINPDWSAFGYLMDSKGLFAGLFQSMATHQGILQVVDFMNMWGLFLIGLGLMAGLFTRFSVICGIILLSFYFLSHPPLAGIQYIIPQEGSYLLVNKTLIEILALFVLLVFPTGQAAGIDRFLRKNKN